MTKTFSHQVTEAKELLAQGNYKQAIELIDSLAPPQNEEGVMLMVLKAEALLYLGASSVPFLEEAVNRLQPTSDNEFYSKAKFLLGWSLVRQGRSTDAIDYLQEACIYFRRYGNLKDLRRALSILAQIAFQKMDAQLVEVYTTEIIKILESSGEENKKFLYLANLARLYIRMGHLKKAHGIFNRNETHLLEHSIGSFINYHLSCSLLNALAGRFDKARRHLDGIKTKVSQFSREKAIYHEYLGLVSIFDTSYDSAITNLNLALSEVIDSAPESDMVSQIKRLFGDLYIAMSNAGLDSRLHGNDIEPPTDIEPRTDKESRTDKDVSFLRRQVGRNPCGSDNDECRNRPPVADFDLQANTSFLRRQESSDESFLRRQETSDVSFLRRPETSIALAEKYASEALAVAEKINERVEIAACYRIFAQVEQCRIMGGEPTASCGAPTIPTTSGGAPSVVNRPHPGPSPAVRRGVPAGGVRILCPKRGYRTDKAREWYKKAA
jgi:tetratricopeptide (TPR) repeat protein